MYKRQSIGLKGRPRLQRRVHVPLVGMDQFSGYPFSAGETIGKKRGRRHR